VKEEDMKMVALASGATIVNKVSDLEEEDLGYADQVEVRKIEEDIWTYITGCKNPKSVSILIRGGTKHMMDEMERSLIDALNVTRLAIEDGKMVTGGGSWAAEASLRVKDYASSVSGREQLAVAAFADALEVLPTTLAVNAGMNRVDTMIELRKAHQNGQEDAGVNVYERKVGSMKAIGVLEPIRVSRQAIYSATDAAVQILRIDDVMASTGDHRPDRGPQGAKGLGQD
jgi:chaperonin GroEL (HSP60 family)